ncbi:unnamed protein product [Cylicostephanus goldi]|uniref:Uncharacterized protein n=1 Tax=Cylicostephanus goldi TaxID=71465 RepID=A0A3P6QVC2_CYLGO|nr:unnamed protein product [Cylicostephanus goldi]
MAKGNNPIEENTTLMNGNNKAADYDESFSRFLYNKDRGTVLGRTAKSWSAFWIACLAIFLNTLDSKVPRFYGKGTIIGINPGTLSFVLPLFSHGVSAFIRPCSDLVFALLGQDFV